jgi:putative ABC transport system permease protein
MFLSLGTNYINEIVVKVRKGKIPGSIQFVKEKSREFNGGSAMDFEFFDERLSQLYVEEEKFAAVIGYFTGLSIFVSCLGLFGMSLFIVQRRVKEIGVRKVLGASRWNILYLIAREFIILVLIASVITIPIAIYLISGWLQNFAYRIDVDIVIVAGTVAAALIITLSTVGIKVLKAAAANPVESLRYE